MQAREKLKEYFAAERGKSSADTATVVEPELVVLPYPFAKINEIAETVYKIYLECSPRNHGIEVKSIDEVGAWCLVLAVALSVVFAVC